MKKLPLALALIWGATGVAHAQSSVTVYGALDVGVVKVTNQTTAIGRGDNNKLGFKGVEDLGGGLAAVFQLEMRYDPDTGTTEASPNRPLFQGESRVGLKGDFGTVLIGRGTDYVVDKGAVGQFEPWNLVSNRANLTSFYVAGYNADPLDPGSSANRFSNAIFYKSPLMNGFQVNYDIATKEALPSGTPTENAMSMNVVYNDNGAFAGTVGMSRNAIGNKLKSLAASYKIAGAGNLKLMGSFAEQTFAANSNSIKGSTIGAQLPIASGTLLAGYGRSKPTAIDATTQFSLGYMHTLSKRTFLYVDGLRRSAPGVSNVRSLDFGMHHDF